MEAKRRHTVNHLLCWTTSVERVVPMSTSEEQEGLDAFDDHMVDRPYHDSLRQYARNVERGPGSWRVRFSRKQLCVKVIRNSQLDIG